MHTEYSRKSKKDKKTTTKKTGKIDDHHLNLVF